MKKPGTFAIESANFYKFEVDCCFSFQNTFQASEVEQGDGGDETDFEPTGEALALLGRELTDFLVSSDFAVRSFAAESEFDNAMHSMSSAEDVTDGYTFMVHCSFIVDFVLGGSNVEPASNDNRMKSYIQPTEAAVAKLQDALMETLQNNYAISDLEATAVPHDLRQCVTLVVPRHLQFNLRRPAARKLPRP
jgi:hypothetical protein